MRDAKIVAAFKAVLKTHLFFRAAFRVFLIAAKLFLNDNNFIKDLLLI